MTVCMFALVRNLGWWPERATRQGEREQVDRKRTDQGIVCSYTKDMDL